MNLTMQDVVRIGFLPCADVDPSMLRCIAARLSVVTMVGGCPQTRGSCHNTPIWPLKRVHSYISEVQHLCSHQLMNILGSLEALTRPDTMLLFMWQQDRVSVARFIDECLQLVYTSADPLIEGQMPEFAEKDVKRYIDRDTAPFHQYLCKAYTEDFDPVVCAVCTHSHHHTSGHCQSWPVQRPLLRFAMV